MNWKTPSFTTRLCEIVCFDSLKLHIFNGTVYLSRKDQLLWGVYWPSKVSLGQPTGIGGARRTVGPVRLPVNMIIRDNRFRWKCCRPLLKTQWLRSSYMSLRTLRTNAYLIERPVFVDSLIFNRSNIAKCESERWWSGVDVPGYAIDPEPMWAEFDGSGGASTNGLRQWTNFGQVVGLAIVSAFRTALDATWVAYALHLPLLYHAAAPQTTSTTHH